MSNKGKPNSLRPTVTTQRHPSSRQIPREEGGGKEKGAKDIMQYFSNRSNQPKKPMIKKQNKKETGIITPLESDAENNKQMIAATPRYLRPPNPSASGISNLGPS